MMRDDVGGGRGVNVYLGLVVIAVVLCVTAWLLSGCATATRYSGDHVGPAAPVIVPDITPEIAPPAGVPPVKNLIHYPRRWLRFHMLGSGAPLLLQDGSLNIPLADSLARYDGISMYVIPLVARPDIVEYLLKKHPGMTIIGELPGGVWENPHPFLGDTTTDLAWARWRVIRDNDAFLYGTAGGWLAEDDNVDRANHRADIALASVDARASVTGVDGLWLDTFCESVLWRESYLDSIDYVRAGYECKADWAKDYRDGHRIYAEAIRSRVPGGCLLIGNCGAGGEQDVFNGWMREGFPFQNGGSWNTNMLGYNGQPGYLTENYLRPHFSILSGFRSGDAYADSVQMVFGIASACLGDGVWEQVAKPTSATGYDETSVQYWPREFDMDLGQPLGKAYPSGDLWRRDFTRGYCEVDPYARTGRIIAR